MLDLPEWLDLAQVVHLVQLIDWVQMAEFVDLVSMADLVHVIDSVEVLCWYLPMYSVSAEEFGKGPCVEDTLEMILLDNNPYHVLFFHLHE